MFLEEFGRAVEAKAINSFWKKRSLGHLVAKAEKHGQVLLSVFGRAKFAERGAILEEARSGVGFVDIFVTFSSGILHVIELKMLRANTVPGPSQLAKYMEQNNRKEGWLVLFDCRKPTSRTAVPPTIQRKAGIVRTLVVDINPIPPHKLK
jgi:RecB family endonuclease NucS